MICELSGSQDLNLQRKLILQALFTYLPFFDISVCDTNLDCPDQQACQEDKECVDAPCPDCTDSAQCEAKNHKGICVCNSGHEGCNAYGKHS